MSTPSEYDSVGSPTVCSPFTTVSASTAASSPCSPVDPSKMGSVADDEWEHVTDPRERRRIQNRLAQRKYREKAAAQREKDRRDARNRLLAGSSYEIPQAAPSQLQQGQDAQHYADEDVGGLPWGGLNMTHMLVRSQQRHNMWAQQVTHILPSQQPQQTNSAQLMAPPPPPLPRQALLTANGLGPMLYQQPRMPPPPAIIPEIIVSGVPMLEDDNCDMDGLIETESELLAWPD